MWVRAYRHNANSFWMHTHTEELYDIKISNSQLYFSQFCLRSWRRSNSFFQFGDTRQLLKDPRCRCVFDLTQKCRRICDWLFRVPFLSVQRLQGERSTVNYCGKMRWAESTSTTHWHWQLDFSFTVCSSHFLSFCAPHVGTWSWFSHWKSAIHAVLYDGDYLRSRRLSSHVCDGTCMTWCMRKGKGFDPHYCAYNLFLSWHPKLCLYSTLATRIVSIWPQLQDKHRPCAMLVLIGIITAIGSGGAYNIVTVLQHRSMECTALMKSSIEHFSRCHTVREIESEDSVLLGILDQHPMCTEHLIMLLQCMQGYWELCDSSWYSF